jgi:hypothetical protein
MELLAAVDALDHLVDRARGIPLTDGARVGAEEFDAAVERIRSAARAGLGLLPGHNLERAIDDLGAATRRIPLTSKLAVSRTRVQDALDRIRTGVAPLEQPQTPLAAAIDAVDELVRQARIVPLTPQVRLEAPELHEALSRLRSLTADLPSGAARVDELERLVEAAAPVPLTSQIRLDPRPFRRVLQRLRTIAAAARSFP